MAEFNVKGNADKGRRILNDNIRKDYARLLELVVAPNDDVDYSEVEKLANKYRMYFDETGVIKEAK